MANKYEVKISYIKFVFDDRNEAIDFAEMAFDKVVEDSRTVEIKIVKVDEEAEGNE